MSGVSRLLRANNMPPPQNPRVLVGQERRNFSLTTADVPLTGRESLQRRIFSPEEASQLFNNKSGDATGYSAPRGASRASTDDNRAHHSGGGNVFGDDVVNNDDKANSEANRGGVPLFSNLKSLPGADDLGKGLFDCNQGPSSEASTDHDPLQKGAVAGSTPIFPTRQNPTGGKDVGKGLFDRYQGPSSDLSTSNNPRFDEQEDVAEKLSLFSSRQNSTEINDFGKGLFDSYQELDANHVEKGLFDSHQGPASSMSADKDHLVREKGISAGNALFRSTKSSKTENQALFTMPGTSRSDKTEGSSSVLNLPTNDIVSYRKNGGECLGLFQEQPTSGTSAKPHDAVSQGSGAGIFDRSFRQLDEDCNQSQNSHRNCGVVVAFDRRDHSTHESHCNYSAQTPEIGPIDAFMAYETPADPSENGLKASGKLVNQASVLDRTPSQETRVKKAKAMSSEDQIPDQMQNNFPDIRDQNAPKEKVQKTSGILKGGRKPFSHKPPGIFARVPESTTQGEKDFTKQEKNNGKRSNASIFDKRQSCHTTNEAKSCHETLNCEEMDLDRKSPAVFNEAHAAPKPTFQQKSSVPSGVEDNAGLFLQSGEIHGEHCGTPKAPPPAYQNLNTGVAGLPIVTPAQSRAQKFSSYTSQTRSVEMTVVGEKENERETDGIEKDEQEERPEQQAGELNPDQNSHWEMQQEEVFENLQKCEDTLQSFESALLQADMMLEMSHADVLQLWAKVHGELNELRDLEARAEELLCDTWED